MLIKLLKVKAEWTKARRRPKEWEYTNLPILWVDKFCCVATRKIVLWNVCINDMYVCMVLGILCSLKLFDWYVKKLNVYMNIVFTKILTMHALIIGMKWNGIFMKDFLLDSMHWWVALRGCGQCPCLIMIMSSMVDCGRVT